MTNNKFDRLTNPPNPLFVGQKERDLVKQITTEILERVLSQEIVYYPISMEATNFHPLYGEAMHKTFLDPIKVSVLIEWTDNPTTTTNYGTDQTSELLIHFHARRLTEDQNIFARVGDFVAYGDNFYEIVSLFEPKLLWGQIGNKVEISAKCIKSRQSLFDAN